MRTKLIGTSIMFVALGVFTQLPVLAAANGNHLSSINHTVQQLAQQQKQAITNTLKSAVNPVTSNTTERTSITLNGTPFSQPYRIVANGTTYMPIYYVDKALQSLGFTATWNGTVHTWTLSNGQSAPSLSINGKTGNTSISVNGSNVEQHVPILQAKDPSSGVMMTFMPIWNVQQILNTMGFTTDTWNGATNPPTWTLATAGATNAPKSVNTANTASSTPTVTNPGDNPSPVGFTMAQWQTAVKQAAVAMNNSYTAAEYSPLATATQWYSDPSDKFYDKSFPLSDLKTNGYVIQNNPRVVVSFIDGSNNNHGMSYVYVLEYVGYYQKPGNGTDTVWKDESVNVKTGQVFDVCPTLGDVPTFEYKKLTPVSGQGINFGKTWQGPANNNWASGGGLYAVPRPNWSPTKD